ncbi:hypothetical protein J3R82DRAFT_344 [Butyriboletus roseoflavus]|nr:hypothetical protein J3R82DRAFT_344 [Butyriboletus roseoflavus]
MLHFPVPFPLLQLTDDDDDDESPSDSSRSTPRSSLFPLLDRSNSRHDDNRHRRSYSRASVDSGYFSMMGKESPISKSFNRKPSGADLLKSPVPLNSPPDATQESPKREGVIKSFLRKKKKSIASSSPPDFDPFATGLSHRMPVEDQVLDIQATLSLPPPRSNPRDPSIDAFEQQDRFVVRRGMKHHPYSRDDAPYMLAYDRTLLDNDKFSDILLRRLSLNHSPSFHDFTQTLPRSILDLGCGSGGWAVEAAEFWPSSQVIGFDLLDPARLRGGAESPSNVQWKQGNFVKYKLPFPKNMFDLVRMANLSLCIPYERWEHVLSEVRRVLAQGGRLELIDDYLHFPYTKRPPQPSADSHDIPSVPQPSSSFDDCNDDEAEEGTDTERRDDDDDDDDDFVSTKSRFSSLVDTDDIPQPAYDPVSEWNQSVDNSKALEKLFEDMLSHKFSVHPRPGKFFDQVIDTVFGRYNQHRLHEFNLYLAPSSSQDSDNSSIGSSESQGSAGLKKAGKDFAKWVTNVEWDHHKEKEKKQRTKGDRSSEESLPNPSIVPDTTTAKAAGPLGVKPTSSHSHPTQSPGLILWPATFIPIAPFELEMHACKHLHSLIGCKAALTEYLQDIARDQNLPFDQQMVEDFIWDYESFRRKRFNWPSECPDSHLEISVPVATTPRSNTPRNSLEAPLQAGPRAGSMSAPPDPLFPREKLDFVRAIRVYSAAKVDEEIHVS